MHIWRIWLLAMVANLVVAGADFQAAERAYQEGSYKRAHELYQAAAGSGLSAAEQRWVQFRLADTLARSEASTRNADDSLLRKAEADLRKFVQPNEPVDPVWAQAHETLGDLQWMASPYRAWGQAWPHYSKALEYWAGSTNLPTAAERYWAIVGKAVHPPGVEPYHYYGYRGNYLPGEVLENALKIARNENEQAWAHYLIAMSLRQSGEWAQRFRVPHEFEQAIKLKKDTAWFDDALYFYAEWMSNQGRGVQDENGRWGFVPDYPKALELYRRILAEFRAGETQWYDEAQNRVRRITEPAVSASVAHVFLPDSEIAVQVHTRNVEEVEFTLYKADLTRAIDLQNSDKSVGSWLTGFDRTQATLVKTWKWQPTIPGPHAPVNESIRLEEKLPLGAYVLVARGGGAESTEIILVTDLSLVMQSTGRQVLVYVCGAGDGAPVQDAPVRLWERYHDARGGNGRDQWHWRAHEKNTGQQGIALFELNAGPMNRELFVLAKSGEKQAFSMGGADPFLQTPDFMRIYAFTDRPAYRPGEKVHWKITARQMKGEVYSVPDGATIRMRVNDPRGGEIRFEPVKLNSFGSAWGEINLTAEMPLGSYQVTFLNEKDQEIGSAVLFRLEEYKLPEFKVSIQTPEKNGRKEVFLLGEKVEVEISAEYYFGGPVANATVEAVVYQNPFYHYWIEPREFSWYFDGDSRPRRRQTGGQVAQRETLKTDANGKAKLSIQTPIGSQNDLEYRIEARVTDASRREITASESVRVTRQRFYVYGKPRHRIYQPQDEIQIEFSAVDANDQPVVAEGTVQVTRDFWIEIWTAPDGREVKGDELKRLREAGNFPPPPEPGGPSWRLRFRGYQKDEILTRTLKTGTNGLATLTFTAEREGYYRAVWRSSEEINPADNRIPSRPIRGEAAVWVATGASADLGYHPGGLEILVDQETVRAGERVPVMLTAPGNDRYVLFTVSGIDLIDYQLVHLDGSVKLLELPIGEEHVPNAFLHAAMVADLNLYTDQEEMIVPPVKNFLTMEVEADRAQYQPGEQGTFRVTTRDHEGKPVSAEVALGVVDESVYYIQEELAGDPRQFFFGSKRYNRVNTSSSFQLRGYRKLLPQPELEPMVELSARFDPASTSSLERRREMDGADMIANSTPFRAGRAMFFDASPAAMTAAPALKMASAVNMPETEDPVQVRSDFRSSIFWQPDLKTDAQGHAEVTVTYPDTLTSWKATARAVTRGNQFGIADETTRTKQPLIVRLQAPRFFLAGDTVTISAVVNNNTENQLSVSVSLETSGIESAGRQAQSLSVAAGAEGRVDWTLHPREPGQVRLKVTARGGAHADAMEKEYPVYEHGIEKFLATAGKSRGDEVLATLVLPEARKDGTTKMSVQVTPSLAVTMLDALPYLIDYPYGCTEQTMSRFLPAAITARTLKNLGLAPEDILGRAFGGIEPGSPVAREKKNLEKLNEITAKGLERLYDFQHADGGWGWWKEGDSDPFMTAYVVWGMALARDAEIAIKEDALRRGAEYLDKQLVELERRYDLQAFALHALAAKAAGDKAGLSEFQTKAFENLWTNRDRLNAYTRALFALAAHHFGKAREARILVGNLENGVKLDEAAGSSVLTPGSAPAQSESSLATAHWGEDGIRWHWSEGGVEATAFALRALLAIDPKHKLVDPVANWLIKNRRGAQWSNTRDTAIVLLALNDYLRESGEINASLEYELSVNGQVLGSRKLAGADVFRAPERFAVPAEAIRDGKNDIKILRKGGKSPIYFAVESSFFSQEEPIPPAGSEIFVKRQYYRLKPVPTLLKGYTFEKEEVNEGEPVTSGERIESVITIEAKNNYEYLVFEDLKPAGLEAVEVQSGHSVYARRVREANLTDEPDEKRYTGDTRWVYQELRDRKVALFIDKLPQGFWEIRYETRAETPGEFHALPVLGHAMYVPEIRANSAEMRLSVTDPEK